MAIEIKYTLVDGCRKIYERDLTDDEKLFTSSLSISDGDGTITGRMIYYYGDEPVKPFEENQPEVTKIDISNIDIDTLSNEAKLKLAQMLLPEIKKLL